MKILMFLGLGIASAASLVPLDLEKVPLKSLPKLPALIVGCEGECCGILKTQKAMAEIVLFESPDKSSKKVGTIKKNEAFEEAEFFTKILKYGEFTEDGKKITVLTYLAEGNWLGWNGKATQEVEAIMGGIKEPTTESWVEIKAKSGLKGWANVPSKDSKVFDHGGCG